MARSRRSSSNSRSNGGSSSNGNPSMSERGRRRGDLSKKKDASGGLFGWAKGAGDWMADKWDSTTEAVGDWATGVGESARELKQAWTATDLGMKDGKITLDTDLDELVDILPENALGGLKLADGGESGNKVHVELDRKTGELTITSGDLRVAGIQQDGLSTGPVSLQGVRISVTNHDGGIPFIDGDFSLFGMKDKDDNVAVNVDVASVVASAVTFQGDEGPVSVDSLLLNGFSLNTASKGGVPFGEKGTTTAQFNVSGAVLRGVSANGTTAEQVEATEVSAGLSGSAETAFLSAGSVSGSNMTGADGAALGSATLNDVRADIRNEGGGMLLLDDQEDRMKAAVSVGSATLDDAKSSDASIDQASMQDLEIFHDAVAGRTELDAASMSVSGIDTATTDVGQATLGGLSVDLDKGEDSLNADISLEKLAASDISSGDASVGSVEASQLTAGIAGKGGALGVDAQLGSIEARDIAAEGATVDSVSASGLATQAAGDRVWMSGQEATVRGAKMGDNSLDALTVGGFDGTKDGEALSASADSISARGAKNSALDASVAAVDISQVSGGTTADGFTGEAGQVSVRGGRMGDSVSVDAVTVRDLAGGKQGDALDGSASSVVVDNAKVDELTVGHTAASDVSARKTASDTQFAAGNLQIDDLAAHNLKAGQINASDAKGRIAGADMSGSLGSGAISDLELADRIAIDSAQVKNVSSGVEGGVRSSTVESAAVSGVSDSVTGASLASGDISGVSLKNTGKSYDASIDGLNAKGLDGMGAAAESVRAADLSVSTSESGQKGSVGELQLDKARFGDTASVDQALIRRASGERAADGSVAGKLGRADVAGLDIAGENTKIGVQNAAVTGADVSRSADGQLSGQAKAITAKGAQFSGTPTKKTGKSDPAVDIDQASLIRSGLARVEDADVNASIGMREGKYDAGVKVGVEANEALDARVVVRDNKLVGGPGGTKATFRQGLDTPLWTELAGAEVDKKGRLKANIDGFFDQNVSKKLNKEHGLEGDRLHDLATYGGIAADGIGKSAGPSPKNGDRPGIAEAFDTDSLNLDARVALSKGTIDAGGASVTLDDKEGANQVAVSSRAGEDLVVSFAQFLASALSVNVGGQAIDAGKTSVDDAQVAVDQGSTSGVSGTVGGVSIEDVRLNR